MRLTLALTAGVPLELVQRVTGHKTTDVVLKHYFRPGQEDFRLALEGAMPKLLTTGKDHGTTDHGPQAEGQGPGSSRKMAREGKRELLRKVNPKALREWLLEV
jgi:hypothetical protein